MRPALHYFMLLQFPVSRTAQTATIVHIDRTPRPRLELDPTTELLTNIA